MGREAEGRANVQSPLGKYYNCNLASCLGKLVKQLHASVLFSQQL